MTGGVAESWARLRLVQGDSSAQVWELVASRGQTTLTVGSGPSSAWLIREEGVRPLHFSLHWDGATLRIADTYGAGDVRVDGEPVTAQWRTIVGRVRVDFGKAAMVAETSAGAESESHPLEPSPLPPISPPAGLDSAARSVLSKATLLGVSPLAGGEVPVELVTPRSGGDAASVLDASPKGGEAAAPEASPASSSDSSPPKEGSFRPARPTDSERARKATLLGMAINAPPPPAVPDIQMPEARAEEAPKPGTPARGIPSGTLIGVVGPLEARVQRLAAQDGKLADKRTILGVPLKDLRVENPAAPQVARPSGDAPGVVTQAEVRSISAPPPAAAGATPPERIGSTWQEIPKAPRHGGSPPMAVLVDSAGQEQAQTRADNDVGARGFDPRGAAGFARGFDERGRQDAFDGRGRTGGFGGFDTRERVSDIPTQMRDMASLDSRRPRRTIPLRYIGIVVLTAAAYMAWLYLLDHL